MSYASLTAPAFPPFALPDLRPLRRAATIATQIAAVALQSLALAATLWLILAAPGLLSDQASTLPTPSAAHR